MWVPQSVARPEDRLGTQMETHIAALTENFTDIIKLAAVRVVVVVAVAVAVVVVTTAVAVVVGLSLSSLFSLLSLLALAGACLFLSLLPLLLVVVVVVVTVAGARRYGSSARRFGNTSRALLQTLADYKWVLWQIERGKLPDVEMARCHERAAVRMADCALENGGLCVALPFAVLDELNV